MEPKKISFSFKKTIAKPSKPLVEEKKEFIECVEEKAIRVVGGKEIQENIPIVIPAQPNTLRNADRLKQIAESVEKGIENVGLEIKQEIKSEIPENETLDQMAVRELLENAQKEIKVEQSELKLVAPENRIPDGAKESTLDDYENIPVGEFGLAMLRGMGWDASQEKSKYKLPELRPKGLGLGADKVVKDNQKKSAKKENEELTIVKNAFIKVVTGKYSNYYGQVVSLDEDNGRVMVNIPMKKETISLSEFMIQPVSKSEYDRESKVINKDSFEAYKKSESNQNKETKTSKVNSRHNSPTEGSSIKKNSLYKEVKDKYNDEKNRDKSKYAEKRKDKEGYRNRNEDDRDKARRREKEETSPEKSRRKDRSSSCSPERSKKSKHKKKRHLSSDSNSSDSDRKYKSKKDNDKRDIDKKRKGKKKRRDRDRSPNYRKHRK